MFSKCLGSFIALVFLCIAGTASAATLKITAMSAAAGQLGYFLVDDAVLAASGGSGLAASQFESFHFSDPGGSGISFDPANVTTDTGVTYFGLEGGLWTVEDGHGDSLTDIALGTALWISLNTVVSFNHGGAPSYNDVSWNTVAVATTPIPAALPLFASALGGLGFVGWRRRRAA